MLYMAWCVLCKCVLLRGAFVNLSICFVSVWNICLHAYVWESCASARKRQIYVYCIVVYVCSTHHAGAQEIWNLFHKRKCRCCDARVVCLPVSLHTRWRHVHAERKRAPRIHINKHTHAQHSTYTHRIHSDTRHTHEWYTRRSHKHIAGAHWAKWSGVNMYYSETCCMPHTITLIKSHTPQPQLCVCMAGLSMISIRMPLMFGGTAVLHRFECANASFAVWSVLLDCFWGNR